MTTSTKQSKRIDDLHFENQLWASETNFFSDELKIYQKRLGEVAFKNTGHDIQKQIERFQNQFIIQKEQLDIINHQVNEHEQWLSKYAKDHPIAIDHVEFADHFALRNKIEVFKKLYFELKADFLKFIATWM